MPSIFKFIKNYWFCPVLLCLAPIGDFLTSFYEGEQNFPKNSFFFYGFVFCWVLLPIVVSLVFAFMAKTRWFIGLLVFIVTFTAQFALRSFVPAGATAEVMGVAFRLGREFPPDEIRGCADRLLQKYKTRNLKIAQRKHFSDVYISSDSVIVDDSELPDSFRGRFACVYIRPAIGTVGDQVVFALDRQTGIVCDNRKYLSDFYHHSIANGVHAYYFQRS